MRVGVVVQARMSSARLPGKVLMPLAGRPLLGWLLERLGRVRCGTGRAALPIVLATSEAPDDDAVAELAASLSVHCHRGSLDDVALRLYEAAESAGFEAFVRASADSPFLDPRLVEEAHDLYARGESDLVSNVFPRSFPKGQSVELIRLEAMREILAATNDPEDREHVTRYAYANPGRFRITGFSAARPQPGLQLSIDTPEDFTRAQRCVSVLGPRAIEAGWEEIAACAGGAA
jgi:spore coat polysaccharide biosynthesis protein SpsF